MSLNVDPFRILETPDTTTFLQRDFVEILEQQGDLVRVDGLEIGANRLFGPQPRTATYLCIWSFAVGALVGSVPPCFVQSLMRAGTAVGLTFTDSDNAPAADYLIPVDPDITALSVKVHSLDVAVRGSATAVQLYLPQGVDLRFDDLASAPFLKHLRVEVPELTLRALAPLFGRSAPWMEVASIDIDLSIVLGLSHSGWEARAREQLAFVALQDSLTKRCPFLYGHGDSGASAFSSAAALLSDPSPCALHSLVPQRQSVPPCHRGPRPSHCSAPVFARVERSPRERRRSVRDGLRLGWVPRRGRLGDVGRSVHPCASQSFWG